MPSKRWNYADVNCDLCQISGSIRIDQYNRLSQRWLCRSCSRKGQKLTVTKPSPKHDPEKIGSWKSYWRAKRRVLGNHKNAYSNVEFRFESFDQWFEVLGPRPQGMSVDRIDTRGHYEPGNVRWATHEQQCRNKNSNVIVEYNGVPMCMTDAAKASGIPYGTLEKRIRAGCPQSHLFLKKRWRYKNGRLADID